MTVTDLNLARIEHVCLGNAEALDFMVNHWAPYVEEVDDIVDGERVTPGEICATFARAVTVYTHPFFLRHGAALRQLVLNITLAYADSAEWERGEEAWKREWANHYRHVAMEMSLAVAMICGGYEHARRFSREHREIHYHNHRNHKTGKPE